jgi:hypothetical protein
MQEILQQSRIHWVQAMQQMGSNTSQISTECGDFASFESSILNYINDVAMLAHDQNVSTLAAQTLNNYQIQNEEGTLDREEPLIARCMNCLNECINNVQNVASLRTINRVSILLRMHLDMFIRRYSYIIHLYQYIAQANPTTNNTFFASFALKPHYKQLNASDERENNTLKLICSTSINGVGTEKCILRLSPNDLVGDLRAELTRWYCTLKSTMGNVLTQTLLTVEKNELNSDTPINASTCPNHFDLLHMSNLPSIRVVTNGQELDRDMDEKTLSECNIKDNQNILINVTTRNRTKDLYNIEERLLRNYIPQKMPMMLLLKYIDQFFSILAKLQAFIETLPEVNRRGEEKTPIMDTLSMQHAEARLVIQRLWDILMHVPTHSEILQQLSQLQAFSDHQTNTQQWTTYLQRSDPFRLTYSLQIIDLLIRRMPKYKETFVRKGGLTYLYDVFISKSFYTSPNERSWCACLPDALLYTLKILCSCLLKIPIVTMSANAQQAVPPPPAPAMLPVSASLLVDEQSSPRVSMNTRKKVRPSSRSNEMNMLIDAFV